MREDYRLLTPENVELKYDVAGLGPRLLAAFVDYAIIAFAFFVLWAGMAVLVTALARPILAIQNRGFDLGAAAFVIPALLILILFVIWWGYFIAFELAWNGSSPGKRLVGLRVVRSDGQPLTMSSSLIRNLLRIVDMSLFLGVLAMVIDQRSRRLGDFAAGTIVVHEPRALDRGTFAQVAIPAVAPDLVASLPNPGRITPAHYAVLRDYFLRRSRLPRERARLLAAELADDFAGLLETDWRSRGDSVEFLATIAHAFELRSTYLDAGVS